MKRRNHIILSVLGIPALAALGYLVTYGLTVANPVGDQSVLYVGLFYLVLIAALLAVPYWTMKFLAHAAHKVNPRQEPEWHLSDVPKDKKQFQNATQRHRHA